MQTYILHSTLVWIRIAVSTPVEQQKWATYTLANQWFGNGSVIPAMWHRLSESNKLATHNYDIKMEMAIKRLCQTTQIIKSIKRCLNRFGPLNG
jgi:hypothetical protein